MKRAFLTLLLAIQVAGGGAITLAHARDVVTAPAGFEASHDGRCAILHDELRCALCHYASARVVAQNSAVTLAIATAGVRFTAAPTVVVVSFATPYTAPARAPPIRLS